MTTTNSFDGTSINWDVTGSGYPVVLVHGITESALAWEPVRHRLAANQRVVTLDLRGHGQSGSADRYDLEALAFDVGAVVEAANVESPHLVGHSLGGAVVTALGAVAQCRSVVCVDQMVRFDGFKQQLETVRPLLQDSATFQSVIEQLFDGMRGRLDDQQWDRLSQLRRPDQDVVLGIWQLIFESSEAELEATSDVMVSGYADRDVPYLALFGSEPNADYRDWLAERVPRSIVEVTAADDGHYPHLVDPDRFVARLERFWSTAAGEV